MGSLKVTGVGRVGITNAEGRRRKLTSLLAIQWNFKHSSEGNGAMLSTAGNMWYVVAMYDLREGNLNENKCKHIM